MDDGDFDVVVTAWDLDPFGPFDVIDLVRTHSGGMPVVVAMDGVGERDAVALVKAGAVDCVSPLAADRLYAALVEAVGEPPASETPPAAVPDSEGADGRARLLDLYEKVIDTAGVWMSVVDPQGNVLLWNRAAEEITGYSRDEVLGNNNIFRWLYPNADDRRALRRTGRDLLTHMSVLDGETTIRRRTGQMRTITWTARSMRDDNGRPEAVLILCADVTEQTLLQRRHSQNERQPGVARMEAVSRLATDIAHDINELLTEIMADCDLLARDRSGDAALCQRLRHIQGAARRGSPLATRLLCLSGTRERHYRVVDINRLLRDVEPRLRKLAGPDIELEINRSPAPAPVHMDPVQLEEAVHNLALNACEAMPAGGKLAISAENVRVDRSCAADLDIQPGHYVLLAVSDTGMGIYEDMQSLIFEPFFSTKPGRQGLGLSTVYACVSNGGGTVQVSSEAGSGCVFKVYLPRVDAPVQASQRPQPSSETRPDDGQRTILVMEDRNELRELMRVVLEREGFRVLIARDGKQALEVSASCDHPLDVLVADIVVPGIQGTELAERLVASRPDLRVVLTSGYVTPEEVADTLERLGASFLRKPFSAQDLLLKVREALDVSRPHADTDDQEAG